MWPYILDVRTKTLVGVVCLLVLVYLWLGNSMLPTKTSRLNMTQRTHINFKHLVIASIVAAQRGGIEVVKARSSKNLETKLKGKTKEGVADVLTLGDRMSNQAMVNSMLYTFPGLRVVSEESLPEAGGDDDLDIFPVHPNHSTMQNDEFKMLPDDIELLIEDLVVWIDPLDATKEYSEGLTNFVTTMVCVARKGEPLIGVIHQPFLNQTYWATKFGVDKKLLHLLSARSKTEPSSVYRVIISRSHKGDIDGLFQRSPLEMKIIEAAGSGFKTLELLKGEADVYVHSTFIKKWDICAPNALLNFASDGQMVDLQGRSIQYHFESHALHRDGLFAVARQPLVEKRELFVSSLHV